MSVLPVLPPSARILFVGEAPGEQEDFLKSPFIGPAGQEFRRMCHDAGIIVANVGLTNVFDERPPNNNLLDPSWSCSTLEWKKGGHQDLPIVPKAGFCIRPERSIPAKLRLKAEIESLRPNLIVALGNIALSALCSQTGIGKKRGAITLCHLTPGVKVLPTYHPSAVLRDWSLRIIAVADLMKAVRESDFPEVRRLERELWLEPTVEDAERFFSEFILQAESTSVDIETWRGQITCVGYAPTPTRALVLPFVDNRRVGWSYYSDVDECRLWRLQRDYLQDRRYTKIFQNGLYDIQYLYRYGIRVRGASEDTMLAHHAMYSELSKGLDFLGSIYTDEIAWKTLRPKGSDKFKRDE